MRIIIDSIFVAVLLVPSLAPAEEVPWFAQELQDDGMQRDMVYSAAKDLLISKGWKVIGSEKNKEPSIFVDFPEISCGAGKDAVCGLTVRRGEKTFGITVKEDHGMLTVQGSF